MPAFVCAQCAHPLSSAPPTGEEIRCPVCGTPFRPRLTEIVAPTPTGQQTTAPTPTGDPNPTAAPELGRPTAGLGSDRAPPGYEILAELGRGGMGIVYKARQVRLDRVVALKMILSGAHASSDEVARFQTEAESLARQSHPGIVAVHEVGEHEGKPYFSLEFCPGGSLERHLAAKLLSPSEAAALVKKLAEAIQAAHGVNVIHRDLKPANVLMSADGTPKITDFGLAKKLDVQGPTQTGVVIGTPSYMAPEQASGTKEIGPTADVYALGAVLYECLVGRPPFRAATPFDTLMQVVSQEPIRLRELNAKVPVDLETIALKCLAKEPARRYASARELADDLGRFLAGEPIKARPVGAAARAAKWVRRNPIIAALWAAVLLVLVAGVAVSSTLAVLARAAAKDATDRAKEATDAKKLADDEEAKARKKEAEANDAKRAAQYQARRAENAHNALLLRQAHEAWQKHDVAQAEDALAAVTGPSRRGWESGHLRELCRRKARRLIGHMEPVIGLAFTADGKRLVSCDSHSVKVWDAETGESRFTIRGAEITCLALSPDGKRLAVAGHTITMYEVDTGKAIRPMKSAMTGFLHLTFNEDGSQLIGGVKQNALVMWDVQTGEVKRTTKGPADEIDQIAYSPNGKVAASRNRNQPKQVSLWDGEAGKQKRVIEAEGPFALSRDGKRLAVGKQIWDTETGKLLQTLNVHTTWVTSVSFSRDGKRVVTACADVSLRAWDVETGQESGVFRATSSRHVGEASVTAVAFSPEGNRIASGIGEPATLIGCAEVVLWTPTTQQRVFTNESVAWPQFSPDGDFVAAIATEDQKKGEADTLSAKVWDARSGKLVHTIRGLRGQTAEWPKVESPLRFSQDGKEIHFLNEDNQLSRWSLETGKPLPGRKRSAPPGEADGQHHHSHDLRLVASEVRGREFSKLLIWDGETGEMKCTVEKEVPQQPMVRFSVDGKRVAATSTFVLSGLVRVWDTETGKHLYDLGGHIGQVFSIGFSGDGKSMVTASGEVKVWDVETGQEKVTLRGFGEAVLQALFSPDSRRILTSSEGREGTIGVWDAETGQQLLALKGHDGFVALAPGDDRLLCSGMDVRVLEAQFSQEELTFAGHLTAVHALAFSPDGRSIASGGSDIPRVWDTQTGQEARTLRYRGLVRNLTFNPTGKQIALLNVDGFLVFYHANTGEGQVAIKQQMRGIRSTFSPDGKRLLATAQLHDTEKGNAVAALEGGSDDRWLHFRFFFSPEGKRIVGCSVEAEVAVWDAETGKKIQTLKQPGKKALDSFALTQDGKELLLFEDGGVVRVLDADTGKEARSIKVDLGRVEHPKFAASPDGRLVAVWGSADGTARVIDTHTGKVAHILRGHRAIVLVAAFSPDGKRLATGSADRTVKIWDVR